MAKTELEKSGGTKEPGTCADSGSGLPSCFPKESLWKLGVKGAKAGNASVGAVPQT